jgi:magnesium-transporting ATPase (P-type)
MPEDTPIRDKELVEQVAENKARKTSQTKQDKGAREHEKEMWLIKFGAKLVALALLFVAAVWIFDFFFAERSLSSYIITMFSSVITLVLGYLFGASRK